MKLFQKIVLIFSIVFGIALILGSSKKENFGQTNYYHINRSGQSHIYTDFDDGYYQSGTKRDFQKYDLYVAESGRDLIWEDTSHTNLLLTYKEAEEYCSNLQLGGLVWRLPLLQESLNLVDRDRAYPALELSLFENTPSGPDLPYWVEESYLYGITVDFGLGTTKRLEIGEKSASVRCVTKDWSYAFDPRFEANGTMQVVTEKLSGLMWQDDNETFSGHTWQESIEQCEALELAGFSDWRMPNINELSSYATYRLHRTGKSLWSSTTVAPYNSKAFVVISAASDIFEIETLPKTGEGSSFETDVVCVRGGELFGGENRPPEAQSQTIQVVKNTPKDIVLHGTDPEHAPLTYSITTAPQNGTITGTPPNVTYTPVTDFLGSDNFKFIVNDGLYDSPEATIDLTVVDSLVYALLKTGETTSYADYDDGYYKKGTPRSFTRDDTLQIVTDNVTGLIWQDNNDAKTVEKDKSGADSYCSDLVLAGSDDWRLPSVEELMLLINRENSDPAIEPLFLNTASDLYITSTTDRTEENGTSTDNFRWLVDFSLGATSSTRHETFITAFFVRCVRGGVLGHDLFTRDDAKEVVLDSSSGLMWQDSANVENQQMAWSQAIDHCEALTEANYTDWRLPNFNELFSIWDRGLDAWDLNGTAIDPAFKYRPNLLFWTSTTNPDYTDAAWAVLYDGTAIIDMPEKSSGFVGVRCVRDSQ